MRCYVDHKYKFMKSSNSTSELNQNTGDMIQRSRLHAHAAPPPPGGGGGDDYLGFDLAIAM